MARIRNALPEAYITHHRRLACFHFYGGTFHFIVSEAQFCVHMAGLTGGCQARFLPRVGSVGGVDAPLPAREPAVSRNPTNQLRRHAHAQRREDARVRIVLD